MRLSIAVFLLASALHADVFVRGLDSTARLIALEDGTVLVSRPELNDVIALRDTDGDGRADRIFTALSAIEHPYGLAMRGRTLYVAGVKKIVAADRRADGTFRAPRDVVSDLPDGGAHPNRMIAVGPDARLYVAIGSSCSECVETNPEHGTLLQISADGTERRVFARGLRDVTALGWIGSELWAVDGGTLVRIGDGVRVAQLDTSIAEASAALLSLSLVRAADGAILTAADGSVYRSSKLPRTMVSSADDAPAMPVLHRIFQTAGLGRPESVLHDEEQDVYFVAGSDGTIAKVTPEGRIAAARFVSGLRAPGGMAIRGGELWVTDVDKLHVFDRLTGARISEMFVDGAVGLTSLAAGSDGAMYVTDSDVRVRPSGERDRVGDGRVYRVSPRGSIEVAASGEELRSPTGIAWDGSRFLIAQGYGRELLTWTPGSGARAFARGPGAYDGLIVLPNGAVLVSSHHDDAIHIARGGELAPLFARRPAPGAIGFDRKRNRLLIPSAAGLEAWALPPIDTRSASREDDEPEVASK